MSFQITGERLTSLFRPRSVALVGASDKSAFSQIAYHNLVKFGFAERTYLVSRRGTQTHGQPTVSSCAQIGEQVDVAYLMVPQAGLLEALDDAAAAGIRNACVLSAGYAAARWRCCRRAGPVPRPWLTSPRWPTSACPTWSRWATRR